MMAQQKDYQSSSSADEKSSSPMKMTDSVSPSHGSTSADETDKFTSPCKSISSTSEMEESESEILEIISKQKSNTSVVIRGHLELAAGDGYHDDDPGDILLLKPQTESADIDKSPVYIQSPIHIQSSPLSKILPKPKSGLAPNSSPSSEDRSDSEVAKGTGGLRLSTERGGRKSDEGNIEDSPQTKKFKRRNQQMYTESGDGD